MMIAYTRIYLGVHFPGDVVGGVTINTWSFPYGAGQPITFIVPASATYVVTFSAGCTMNYWNELY